MPTPYGMKLVFPAFAVAGLSACAHADRDADRDAILAIYESQRAAHFEQDARRFLAAVDSGYLSIANGAVQYRRREDALDAVGSYLGRTHFTDVRDVAPPRIHIAADGRSAWLIGEVEVRGAGTDSAGTGRPFAFRSAWIDLYEKSADGWRLVARANTQRDLD